MAATKHANTDIMVTGLNEIHNVSAPDKKIIVFDGLDGPVSDPPTYAEIINAALHDESSVDCLITTNPPSGPAGGDVSLQVNGSNELTVDKSGNANGVAIIDLTGTVLWYTTTISNPQDVVNGNKITIGIWTITINQPTP